MSSTHSECRAALTAVLAMAVHLTNMSANNNNNKNNKKKNSLKEKTNPLRCHYHEELNLTFKMDYHFNKNH